MTGVAIALTAMLVAIVAVAFALGRGDDKKSFGQAPTPVHSQPFAATERTAFAALQANTCEGIRHAP